MDRNYKADIEEPKIKIETFQSSDDDYNNPNCGTTFLTSLFEPVFHL